MNRLPTELTDYIIDFHHSDRRTLKVSSLVCHNWLPPSRFHLFESVFIHSANIHSFVKLLVSPSSTIASYVRTLQIYNFSDTVPVFDVIAPHFKDFVALKTMSLEGLKWVPINEKSLPRTSGNMDLTRIFYDFSSSWFRLSFAPSESSSASFSSTLRVLHSAIHGIQPSSWLPIVGHLPSIRQVGLYNIQENHLPAVQALLKSGGQFIHTVNLEIPFEQLRLTWISDCVDLTHNTNLRSLCIFINLDNSQKAASHESFSKIIQRISSPSFSQIEISVSIVDRMDLTWLSYEKVAGELNHPRFSELQKVSMNIRCPRGKRDGMMAWVRGEMSCLDIRGILTVTIYGD